MSKDIEFINLTPHSITDVSSNIVYPSKGAVRIKEIIKTEGVTGNKTKISSRAFSDEVEGLPTPKKGVFCIVSSMAAEAVKKSGRTDIVIPGPAIRDAEGKVIGCDGFYATESTDVKMLLAKTKTKAKDYELGRR